jgi:hypothetical protein
MSGSQIILVFDIMNMLEMTEVHIRVLVVAIVVLKLPKRADTSGASFCFSCSHSGIETMYSQTTPQTGLGFSCSHSGIETWNDRHFIAGSAMF